MHPDYESVSLPSYWVHNHRNLSGGWTRAAVFGVSDGLVSNAALIMGVAAAHVDPKTVVLTGVSGLLAGGASMAAGEYVSMKAQNELIERELKIEEESIRNNPAMELLELEAIYMARGLAKAEAKILAEAIHRDKGVALEVHAREELGVDPENIGNPQAAAGSSFVAFALGAAIPLFPWLVSDGQSATIGSLLISGTAAAGVGLVLARFTERSKITTAWRQVGWAAVASSMTYLIGSLFESSVS